MEDAYEKARDEDEEMMVQRSEDDLYQRAVDHYMWYCQEKGITPGKPSREHATITNGACTRRVQLRDENNRDLYDYMEDNTQRWSVNH